MNPANIKKNDNILVTRDNGKEYLGVATKVGPWSKNPKVTVVNYHFKDEMGVAWSAKADARKCRMAPADMIPKAPEAAPTHPIMAKWSLGKTKRGPEMMEGYYFAVPVLLNGKRVGEIIDEGNGGGTMTRFKDRDTEKAFLADCKAWCVAHGDANPYECEGDFWGWWDESRPKGKDSATHFKEEAERWAEMTKGQTPITNSDAFANAVNKA